jgi:L-asparaginase
VPIQDVIHDIQLGHPESDLHLLAEIDVVEALREGAETFTPDEWIKIATAVSNRIVDTSIAGVVVTHGTFSAEETAYYLHLTVPSEKPVVVVCSQRKHGALGNDGDRNLRDAIRVVMASDSCRRGVLVTLNEEIHSARDVVKTNQRPSGFSSGLLGILGSVEDDRVSFYRAPERRHTFQSEFRNPPESLPRVDIVATYPGADGTAIEAFLAAGAAGIVVSGFAYSGKPHFLQLAALERAIEDGVPVVLASRGLQGRIPLTPTDGFVRADNLSPQKARVLLGLALLATRDAIELQRIFNEY